MAGLLTLAILLGSCGGDDRQAMVDTIFDESQGLLATSEAECWADILIEEGVTTADLRRFRSDPFGAAPDARSRLRDCIDPAADVQAPFVGAFRSRRIAEWAEDGVPPEAGACVLDELAAAGVDRRDFFVAGLDEPTRQLTEEAMVAASTACSAD